MGSPSLHSTPWGALTLGLPLPGGQCSPALTLPPPTGPPEGHFLRFLFWATPGGSSLTQALLGSCAWGAPPPGAHHYTTCAQSPRAHRGTGTRRPPAGHCPASPDSGRQGGGTLLSVCFSASPPRPAPPPAPEEGPGRLWSPGGAAWGGGSKAAARPHPRRREEGRGLRQETEPGAGNPTAPAPGPRPLTSEATGQARVQWEHQPGAGLQLQNSPAHLHLSVPSPRLPQWPRWEEPAPSTRGGSRTRWPPGCLWLTSGCRGRAGSARRGRWSWRSGR